MKSFYKVTMFIVAAIALSVVFFAGQQKAQSAGGTATYRYDSLGRLVQDVYPANSGAYSYDNAGNRTSATTN